jgi:hypothetical protein
MVDDAIEGGSHRMSEGPIETPDFTPVMGSTLTRRCEAFGMIAAASLLRHTG